MENHDHKALIRQLLDCAMTCEHCADACLHEENMNHMAECIRIDRDCADICIQAARLLRRGSVIDHRYLEVCAEICWLCADECLKHEHDHCRECAKACKSCAEACKTHYEAVS